MIYNYEYQVRLAERIQEFYIKGYKHIILSCPCGYGKSGLAYQLHRMNAMTRIKVARKQEETEEQFSLFDNPIVNNDYDLVPARTMILNHNRILVDQYESLMGKMNDVLCIKGMSNYKCKVDLNRNCDEAPCQLKANYKCSFRSVCEYYRLKDMFAYYPLSITNYQFVLYNLMSDSYYRYGNTLLICDECHNLDSIIASFYRVIIDYELVSIIQKISAYSIKFDLTELRLSSSKILSSYQMINEDNFEKYFDYIFTELKLIIKLIEQFYKKQPTNESSMDYYAKVMGRYISVYDQYNKVRESVKHVFSMRIDSRFEYSLTPLYIKGYFQDFIDKICNRTLLMSGTIVNPKNMIKTIGIDPAVTTFIDIPSLFDKTNRPIFFRNIAKLNASNCNPMTEEFRDIINEIFSILKIHCLDKHNGIIFVPSYTLGDNIFRGIESQAKRLGYTVLINKSAKDSKRILDEFTFNDGRMKLLISPSFEEGVNFAGDISRFQIIVKAPFPSFSDTRTKEKASKDQEWYNSVTLNRIIQSSARSVRNSKDYAVTYILDENAYNIYKRFKHQCPNWFNESIVDMEN